MPKFLDLTGKIYGELKVVEMLKNYNNTHRTYCKCEGVDGNEYIIRQDALQSGATKFVKGATKAGKINDISGQRFGRLVALYPTQDRAANSGIVWKCRCDCGRYTVSTSNNLKRHHTTSCGCKKRSKGEQFIVDYLNTLDVEYETEKAFDGCRNEKGNMNLYFDFYFPSQKTVIEYDGALHFEGVEFFGGQEHYENLLKCDAIKDEYCKRNGIIMVRIPYTKTKEEVIQIINNIIHP